MRTGDSLDRVRSLLSERIAVLLRRRQRARRQATPESLHDLRVATRRLQECLDLFSAVLPRQPRERLRRRARRIRRDLSEVRDADVLLALIRSLHGPASLVARRSLRGLERRLSARARSLRRHPARSAGPRIPIAGIRKRTEALLRGLPPGAGGAIDVFSPGNALARRLAARAGSVRGALRRAPSGSASDLHRLRVAIKRYRYTLELLEACGVSALKPEVEAARRIQEALGAVHDMDVLIAWMRREAATAPVLAWARAERRARAAAARAVLSGFRPVRLETTHEEPA